MLLKSASTDPSYVFVRQTNKQRKIKKRVSHTNVICCNVPRGRVNVGVEAIAQDPTSDLADVINRAHLSHDRSRGYGEGSVTISLPCCIGKPYRPYNIAQHYSVRASDTVITRGRQRKLHIVSGSYPTYTVYISYLLMLKRAKGVIW